MSNDVRVTAMRRTKTAANRGGTRIVAFFDADIPSFAMRGCALALKAGGEWIAWTPKLPEADEGARCAVYFGDTRLQRATTEAALAVYRHLGGDVGLEQNAAQAA
jgi:hypothetical protein